jgi:hypothetical protein
MPRRARCQDVEWVCENHRDRPWAKDKPNGCECGAGAPCPDCNQLCDSVPSVDTVITDIDMVRRK